MITSLRILKTSAQSVAALETRPAGPRSPATQGRALRAVPATETGVVLVLALVAETPTLVDVGLAFQGSPKVARVPALNVDTPTARHGEVPVALDAAIGAVAKATRAIEVQDVPLARHVRRLDIPVPEVAALGVEVARPSVGLARPTVPVVAVVVGLRAMTALATTLGARRQVVAPAGVGVAMGVAAHIPRAD